MKRVKNHGWKVTVQIFDNRGKKLSKKIPLEEAFPTKADAKEAAFEAATEELQTEYVEDIWPLAKFTYEYRRVRVRKGMPLHYTFEEYGRGDMGEILKEQSNEQ